MINGEHFYWFQKHVTSATINLKKILTNLNIINDKKKIMEIYFNNINLNKSCLSKETFSIKTTISK